MKKKPIGLPKPHDPQDSFSSAVMKWAGGTLSYRSGYYAGRGPNRDDLSENHMERLFEGINKDYSPQHAELFVDFVEGLTDFSASAFLVAFECFFYSGCSNPNCHKQVPGDGNAISAHGDDPNGRLGEGLGAIFSVLSDRRSPDVRQWESEEIKWAFLSKHARARKVGSKRGYCNLGYNW